MIKAALVVFSALLSASLAAGRVPQSMVSISGTVVDENDAPVPAAKVNAESLDRRLRLSPVRYVDTDVEGYFLIDDLAFGTYIVTAMKERSGYPNLRLSFYSNDVYASVSLSPKTPAANVRLRVGPKAGTLTGRISDAETGRPVSASIELSRSTSPDKSFSTSVPPHYWVLLPPSTDVSTAITAPGYKTWTARTPLNLQPGAELRLDVSLEPLYDPSLQPSEFLIPEGYAGWVLLVYNEKGATSALVNDGVKKVFKFPEDGLLTTSSSGPERGAARSYLYYSKDGSVRNVPMDYRNGGGMVWGEYEGTKNGAVSEFGFFIGTEEAYSKAKTRRPIQ